MERVVLQSLRDQFAAFESVRTARRAECARLAEASESQTLRGLYAECRRWYELADEECEELIQGAEFAVSLLRDIMRPAGGADAAAPSSAPEDSMLGKIEQLTAQARRDAERARADAVSIHDANFIDWTRLRLSEYEQLCRVDPATAAIRAGMVILKSFAKQAIAGAILPGLPTETLRNIRVEEIGETINVLSGLQLAFRKIPLIRSDGLVELESLNNALVEFVYRTEVTKSFIHRSRKTSDDIASWRLRPDQPWLIEVRVAEDLRYAIENARGIVKDELSRKA